ncbi:MAG: hypothetical protein NT116_06095 [Candidatus Parcubacteria bacterium]|nr:hypothetical protein [Candidatus Parcubacteria bacterium]
MAELNLTAGEMTNSVMYNVLGCFENWEQTKRRQRKDKICSTISGPLAELKRIRSHLLKEGFNVGTLKVKDKIRKRPAQGDIMAGARRIF